MFIILTRYLAVTIKAASQVQGSICHGLWQPVSGDSGDGEEPCASQEAVTVVRIIGGASGIGESIHVEVIVVSKGEGLSQGTTQRF